MAVRGLGCPVRFTLTAGQKGDAPQAAELIEGLPAEVVMADTAYDADPLRQAIAAKGAIAVIPNNPSRALKYPLDKYLYAQRHLVECCFSKLKQFRRVATRFEKTARNYRAVVTLAAIILWMRSVRSAAREWSEPWRRSASGRIRPNKTKQIQVKPNKTNKIAWFYLVLFVRNRGFSMGYSESK